MQNFGASNKELGTFYRHEFSPKTRIAVQNTKNIKELLNSTGNRLGALRARAQARSEVLSAVRAALEPTLAAAVASAGIEQGRLTIGVAGAVWASRLRYATHDLRKQVGERTGTPIHSVRIRVVPRLDPRP